MSRIHRLLAPLLAAAFCVGWPEAGIGQPTSRPEYKKTATKLVSFGIPFSIADPDDRFIEVQLYLSKNRGQTWQFYARESTAAKEFPFTSSGDGTYWFALRTLDRDRRVHPEGPMLPELEVIVDTKPPQVDFRIQTDPAGRIVCRWNAQDENIDPKSTRLSFRPLIDVDDRNNVWIPVPYRPIGEAKGGSFADQYAWWPDTAAYEVLVQFQISDVAGNAAVEERQIVVPRTSRRSVAQSMVTQGSPQSSNATPIDNRLTVEAQRPPSEGSGSAAPPQRAPVVWDSNTPSGDRLNEFSRSNWPTVPDQRPNLTIPENAEQKNDRSLPPVPPVGGMRTIAPPSSNHDQQVPPTQQDQQLPPTQEHQKLPPTDQQVPPTGSTSPFQPTGFQPKADPAGYSVLKTARMQVPDSKIESINQRRFRLNYAFDQLDPNQIEKVVLWMTHDAGYTWSAYGEDGDRTSPFPIELEQPGLYGFRIVFHTKDGRTSVAPKSGDDADYWVRLDVDAPRAAITGAPYGRDDQAGSLIIQWQAEDDLLAARPITIEYAVHPDGPWTTIAAGIDNSGAYAWKVGAEVPPRVYLRLTATDAAGNSTCNQTQQPVDLSGLVPKARILGVDK